MTPEPTPVSGMTPGSVVSALPADRDPDDGRADLGRDVDGRRRLVDRHRLAGADVRAGRPTAAGRRAGRARRVAVRATTVPPEARTADRSAAATTEPAGAAAGADRRDVVVEAGGVGHGRRSTRPGSPGRGSYQRSGVVGGGRLVARPVGPRRRAPGSSRSTPRVGGRGAGGGRIGRSSGVVVPARRSSASSGRRIGRSSGGSVSLQVAAGERPGTFVSVDPQGAGAGFICGRVGR